MKLKTNKFLRPATTLTTLATLALWVCSVAAPADQAAKESPRRSTFVMPANPNEGHDPFFPDSLRPYESAVVNNNHTAEITSLVLKGVSGPPGHRLVIINNHTFGSGDEGDVTTSQGRLHVRCVEIRADSVVIESGGQRVILNF